MDPASRVLIMRFGALFCPAGKEGFGVCDLLAPRGRECIGLKIGGFSGVGKGGFQAGVGVGGFRVENVLDRWLEAA